jgi:hypothetical protein
MSVNVGESPEKGRKYLGGRWPLVVFSRRSEADASKEEYFQGLD